MSEHCNNCNELSKVISRLLGTVRERDSEIAKLRNELEQAKKTPPHDWDRLVIPEGHR